MIKPSEIIRAAANEHLWDGTLVVDSKDIKATYSCDAVNRAVRSIRHLDPIARIELSSTMRCILEESGCPVHRNAFRGFREVENQQGARFLWLDFLARVLEDEGR